MYCVGTPSAAATRLVRTTYDAMCAGIRAVRPGTTLGDVGHAIQSVAHAAGQAAVRQLADGWAVVTRDRSVSVRW